MATTTQDPAVQDPNAGVTDVSRSPKERIGGIISALTGAKGEGSLDDVINQHHQKRLDQARRSRHEWSTYHSVGLAGVYPEDMIGQDKLPHKAGEPLTDADKAYYQNAAEGAWADYEKAAGINPQAKKSLQQNKGIIDRVSQLFTQHKEQQGGGGGGLPAPPAAAATPATSTGSGEASENAPAGGGLPPPPSAQAQASTTGPSPTQVAAADAPRIQQKLDEERQFKFWKRQQDVLRDSKIAENEALAAARAANRPVPRPVPALSIGVLDARNQRDGVGKTYIGTDGDPIDLDKLPDTMGLKGVIMKDPDTNQWETRYEPFSPNQKTVTVGNETMAVSPMDISKLGTGKAGTDLGVHNVPVTRKTNDPVTGQTSVSVSTPSTPGLKAGSLPAPPSATAPATTPATAAPAGGGTPRPTKAPAAASAPPAPAKADGGVTLDKDGLIPADTPGYSPQVIEAANELIQDRDVSKTPAKTQLLGAALARKAGWFQGKWTPQDESRINQTKTFLEKMRDSDTLKVLDSSAWNRFWIDKAGSEKSKTPGLGASVSNFFTASASKKLTDAEAEFNRLNNQLISVAAGISTLTRAGRATNAMIDSIRREMPNALSTKDSKDAKERINNLLQEIENARKIGVGGAAQRRSGGGGLEKPPAAKGEGAKPAMTDAAKTFINQRYPNARVP